MIQKVVSRCSGVSLASRPAGPATNTEPTSTIQDHRKPAHKLFEVHPQVAADNLR